MQQANFARSNEERVRSYDSLVVPTRIVPTKKKVIIITRIILTIYILRILLYLCRESSGSVIFEDK